MRPWKPEISTDDPYFDKWCMEVMQRNFTPLENSAVFLAIASQAWLNSGKGAIEIGLAMFLDKPIYLLTPANDPPLPKNIRAVCKAIAHYNPDDNSSVKAAGEKLLKQAMKNGHVARTLDIDT